MRLAGSKPNKSVERTRRKGRANGQQLPLRRVLREDRSGSGLENAHQVNALDELLVLLSLVVGQLSVVGFGGQLLEPGLRLRVELEAHDPLGDFWCQAFSERPQKAIENSSAHVSYVTRAA